MRGRVWHWSLMVMGVLAASLPARAQGKQTEALDKLLQLPFEELLKVVVTGSSRGQILREVPATLQVITAQQIAARGYQTLEDALQDLPGIDFVHVGGAFPTVIAPRGAYGDENRRILLMIDGQVENSLNGAFELGGPSYSLYGVERVEVLFGPASALYGANAFSGIINLISKRAGERPDFGYRRTFGRFDTQRDDLSYSRPLGERWSLSIAGTRVSSDGPRLERVIAAYSDSYIDTALGWNLRLRRSGEHSETLFGVHGHDTPMGNGQFGNTPTRFLGLPPRSAANPGTGGFYHADIGDRPPGLWHPYNRTVFVEHVQRWNGAWQAKGILSRRQDGLRDDTYSFSMNRAGTALSRFRGAYDSERRGLELQISYAPNERHNTTAGVQYFRNDLEKGYRTVVPDPSVAVIDGLVLTNLGAMFNPRDAVQTRDRGIYIEHQHRTEWLHDTRFTLGARYDSSSLYGNSFNPRLGLVNQPGHGWTFKLLYGSAYRAPTPFELFSSSPVRVANPELEPERVKSLEFGASREFGAHMLQASLFYNRLQEVIVEGIPVGQGRTQIQNAAEARIRGLTANWDYRPAGAFSLYANVSLQDGTLSDPLGTRVIPNIARVKANLGVQWDSERFGSLHLGSRWVGKRSVSRANPLDEVAGYGVIDAHVMSRPLWNERLRLGASLRNLADRHYTDPGIRNADGGSFAPDLEQTGRSWWLSLELRL